MIRTAQGEGVERELERLPRKHSSADDESMASSGNKRPMSSFCSASSLMMASLDDAAKSATNKARPNEDPQHAAAADAENVKKTFHFQLAAVGLKHYNLLAVKSLAIGTAVTLLREPYNPVDERAIKVCVDGEDEADGLVAVGMLFWQQARDLSPLMDDDGLVEIIDASVSGSAAHGGYELPLAVSVRGIGQDAIDRLDESDALHGRKVIGVSETSMLIAARDEEASRAAAQRMTWPPLAPPRSWEPNHAGWKPSSLAAVADEDQAAASAFPPAFALGWEPHSPPSVAPLTRDEVVAAQARGWPPEDATLLKLGLAPAGDAAWYGRFGLKPLSDWDLIGALDLLPSCGQPSSENKKRAAERLDGGAHGVRPWTDATLDALTELMRGPSFWCRRRGDAYIRAFGGPYVLGQEEGKLKLIHGATHTPLTATVCKAHSLIYTAVHLAWPPAPGFSTIILGLNNRAAGFWYHQDAEIGGLHAKNAPLVPNQPVVTTVLYEKPEEDGGKEVVLWRPTLNWDTMKGFMSAARALETPHGLSHIQRAGLQRQTKHGVFHAPGTPQRVGWRVALTARITKPDAEALVRAWAAKGAYSEVLGPDGTWSLPHELADTLEEREELVEYGPDVGDGELNEA